MALVVFLIYLMVFQPALWKYPSVAILSGAKYLVTKMQTIAAQGQILHRSSELRGMAAAGSDFSELRARPQPSACVGRNGVVIDDPGGGDVPQAHAQGLEQRNVVIGLSARDLPAHDLP